MRRYIIETLITCAAVAFSARFVSKEVIQAFKKKENKKTC